MAGQLRLAGIVLALGFCLSGLAAPARAEPVAAIQPGNILIRFDTGSPSNVTTVGAVTGLGANETIRGIDVRPATGQVYVTTVTTGSAAISLLMTYTLNADTAVATSVGATAAALAGAGDVPTGYDFSPTVDRIRYVNTNDENARLNPDSGALAGNDTDLTTAATTTVIGAAYDRNRQGAAASTLFAVDRNDSMLSRQGGVDGNPSTNGGVVTDIATLGFALNQTNDGGFDVSPSGTAYAALTPSSDNLTRLYTIALGDSSNVATAIGLIGNGMTEVRSIAILDDDRDVDGVLTTADNCDATANADQANLDSDGLGDVCDDDRDGDGDANSADNCPDSVNSDQANLDGDGLGDLCDDDDDADGLADATEAQIGTNPRLADSDGDGKLDGADACTLIAGTEANGCPPLLGFTIAGFPKKIGLRKLRRRGVAFSVRPNVPSSFVAELLGKAKGGRLARVGQIVLAEKSLPTSGGKRTIRLTVPKSQTKRLRGGIKLQLRVTARDGIRRTTVRKVSLRVTRR